MSKPSLDIIIVNWNSRTQLRECLKSIFERDDSFDLNRVIVVDNASSDGSTHGLEDLNIPLTVIDNMGNRGFGAACNQGAYGSQSDYLLFLNPDTRLQQNSISIPISFMERREDSDVGVSSIQLIDETGAVSRSCTRLPTPAHFFSKMLGLDRINSRRFPSHYMTDWDHCESREVDHVMGAFYLIRRKLFEKISGFDERFFVYLEDLDLSLRVRREGSRIYYLVGAKAFHKGGGASEQIKATRLYYSLRSRIQYGFKHFGWATATFLMLGTLILEPVARIGQILLGKSNNTIIETLKGFWELWRTIPQWIWTSEVRRSPQNGEKQTTR